MPDDAIDPRLPSPTATLERAEMIADAYGRFLVGDVYGDAHGRWPDGTHIRTSRLEAQVDLRTFRTLAGSIFKVGSWSVRPVGALA